MSWLLGNGRTVVSFVGSALQEYLRAQLIGMASRPDVETVLARIAERKQRTGSGLLAAEILAHRDAGRR